MAPTTQLEQIWDVQNTPQGAIMADVVQNWLDMWAKKKRCFWKEQLFRLNCLCSSSPQMAQPSLSILPLMVLPSFLVIQKRDGLQALTLSQLNPCLGIMVPLRKSWHLLWVGYEEPLLRFLSSILLTCFPPRTDCVDDDHNVNYNLFFWWQAVSVWQWNIRLKPVNISTQGVDFM